jgi:inhibitor of KinA sporulation pathway (predicted exonuclease)
LTGITEQDLNEFGITFDEAIKKLNSLMKYHGAFRCNDFVFVTVTDWDIGRIIQQQAKISRKKLPWYFKRKDKRMDLQKEFYYLHDAPNMGLKNMLKHYGEEFNGTHHNSVDDCLNTLRLFKKMYEIE